ncbi:flippase-like domain-containing protein [Halorubellus sp. PRR65]|uniref:lysylphosphatidylglycerol synthase transmembrane domain-containing protein n=1 Tax=Halorubellus sp. PRR65 TaxID=3098148 RepID=UPI002B25A4C4|nr:flippase-like domain-containing protein [Halorubellus sp. PRR65]
MTRTDGSLADVFGRQTIVKIAVGFAIAIALLAILATAIGWRSALAELRSANPVYVALGCLSTALGLMAWGKAWQVVLRVGNIDAPYRKLVVTYFAATFANYVTPLGQAGGEPFIAYVLSRDTEADYEQSLASVVTADLLNLLPFFNFAAVGTAYLVLSSGFGGNGTADGLAVALGAMAVGVPGIVWAGWHWRDAVESLVLSLVKPVTSVTNRITVDGTRDRIERFYESVERIASDPRQLLVALAFSYVGWLLFALPMWFAVQAVSAPVGLLMVLFIVPASTIAGLVPTPGGLAAVEGAIIGLIVSLTATTGATATAVTTLYRLESYVFALVLGGIAAFWVTYRT